MFVENSTRGGSPCANLLCESAYGDSFFFESGAQRPSEGALHDGKVVYRDRSWHV